MSLVCFVAAMLETISLAKSETSCARVWDCWKILKIMEVQSLAENDEQGFSPPQFQAQFVSEYLRVIVF